MARKVSTTHGGATLEVAELGAFLGADLETPTTPQPVDGKPLRLDHDGWPCSLASPLMQEVRKLFPIQVGQASMRVVGDHVWCIAPTESRRAYLPAIEVQVEVRGWRSAVQQVYLPQIPTVKAGALITGGRRITSVEKLASTYRRELGKRAHFIEKALASTTRMKDELLRMVYPIDFWC